MPEMKTKIKKWFDTICLPKTRFPMKADLAKREPSILEYWQKSQTYKKILDGRKNNADRFLLHDGPPYANGHFHVGHALNKILKDMINKYHLLQGKYVNYIPGWDCHGLPIELAVIKKLAKQKDGSEKDPHKVRAACREYANHFIHVQAQDQSRLGIFWNGKGIEKLKSILSSKEEESQMNFYYTMSKTFEANILQTFRDLYEKEMIYKNKKPIHWCFSCSTALAEAEIEYDLHKSPSIYVAFPVKKEENLFVIIWTTTPWTLPANLGVAFHPKFEYAIYHTPKGRILLATGMEERFFESVGLDFSQKEIITSEQIKGLEVMHPFLERESKVLFGDNVTLEHGTGIVHTAPGHGNDDYNIGLKYNLDVYCPVDHRGRFTAAFPEMEGVKIFDANPGIIQKLEQKDLLVHSSEVEHSYPHCWRCHKPLIFRATPQWFFSMDTLKELSVKEVKKVEWIPGWGEKRFHSMIENRPDWCLSRQRFWGVPIPAFQCDHCKETHLTIDGLDHIIKLVQKEGIEVWFEKEIEYLLPKGAQCLKCNSTKFKKRK